MFDASSHLSNKPSLNEVLDKGPNIENDLLQMLLEFRCSPVVLIADIRKAFLQIGIRPSDRDALRFLWVDQLPCKTINTPNVVEWRMTRVPFGASSSPFLLAATLRHHIMSMRGRYPDMADRLIQSFYVDDLVLGCSSEDDALQAYQQTRSIITEAGMDLRKRSSSLSSLQNQFMRDEISYENAAEGETDQLKVLGVMWDRTKDETILSTQNVTTYLTTQSATKRTILQAFARIFDPFGYLVPFTTQAKLLFQALWVRKCSWDEGLSAEELAVWNSWCSDLVSLSSLRIPRYVIPPQADADPSIQLHVFADASPRAYGTAIYLRAVLSNGSFTTQILIAKGRVAPLKPHSLPRLELIACLLGARLLNYVRKVSGLEHVQAYFWTDSEIALH